MNPAHVLVTRRFARIGFLMLLMLIGGAGIAWRWAVRPPETALSAMENAFREFTGEGGPVYVPALARRAEDARRQAIDGWRREDGLPFFRREYRQVELLARRAETLAREGTARTRLVKDSIQSRTDVGISLLRSRIDEMSSQLDRLPEFESLRQKMRDARTDLAVAETQNRDGDLLAAAAAVDHASSRLEEAGVVLDRLIDSYFSGIPQWKIWVAETVKWSATHRTVALVVDKMAHMCTVYSKGRQIAAFDVELGPQWVGPKRYEGDLSTPEGKYHVKRKRGPGETKYYLALEIDYPNGDDRRRFEEAKRSGDLPRAARLGGSIELHGSGGKTFNWTKGCIALTDRDMRALFDMVEVGTPVTIVGALEHPFPDVGGRAEAEGGSSEGPEAAVGESDVQ